MGDKPSDHASEETLSAPDHPDMTPAHPVTDVKGVWQRLGPAGPLAVAAASLPALGGFVLLGSMTRVAPWLQEQGDFGIALYILGFTVFAGLALLPTYSQALLAGWAFGKTIGSLSAVTGFVGASVIGYLIARRASGDRAVQLMAEHPKWKAVYDALLGSGFGKSLLIVTLLRISPNSPFAITNLVLAATKVPRTVFVLGTLFGMTPRTVAAVVIGSTISQSDFDTPRETWMLVSGVALTIVVVAIIGSFANRAIARMT